jgi:hypothetical protein
LILGRRVVYAGSPGAEGNRHKPNGALRLEEGLLIRRGYSVDFNPALKEQQE